MFAFLETVFFKNHKSPLFHVEISTRGYGKTSSKAINLVESPWQPPTKGHLVLYKNIGPAFLFVRIALLHDASM